MKITPHEYHDLRARYARALDGEPVDVAALRAIDAEVSAVRDHLVALRDQRAALILVADPNVRRTAEEQAISDHAEDDVKVLEGGLWGQGYWDTSLKEVANSIGIVALDRLIADCREVIEHETSRPPMTWPAQFEYCGLPGRAELEGRLLRVGDRVMLTESQATAWADRFRPVDYIEVETV